MTMLMMATLPESQPLFSKAQRLYEMSIDADERLFKNRKERQKEFDKQLTRFRLHNGRGIDQSELGIL